MYSNITYIYIFILCVTPNPAVWPQTILYVNGTDGTRDERVVKK